MDRHYWDHRLWKLRDLLKSPDFRNAVVNEMENVSEEWRVWIQRCRQIQNETAGIQ